MPFPAFNIDGVIPPFVGARGPGDSRTYMSPHEASPVEVIARLGGTPQRRNILKGWLAHRMELRAVGVVTGFQWLDGSFVEDKEPNDLDIVTFFRRPLAAPTAATMAELMMRTPSVFSRAQVKEAHHLDAQLVDLNATPEAVVDLTRYWAGIFSHRRGDLMWKGMLKVDLDDRDDDLASLVLEVDP